MTWKYSIKWHNSHAKKKTETPTSIVLVTSKPRSRDEEDLINIRSWANGNSSGYFSSLPVTIYVSVTKGDWPVLDARVTLKISVQDNKTNNIVKMKPVEMLDDGYGGKEALQFWNDLSPFS